MNLGKLKTASQFLRKASSERKNAVLKSLATLLILKTDQILNANARDLKALPKKAAPAFRDRLTLNRDRIQAMSESLEQVAALPDPVNEVVEEKTLPSGLHAKKQRSPLGVLFLIFESRPNVAVESFSLAFKAGNALLLRGGKESKESVKVLTALIQDTLKSQNFPLDCCMSISDPKREVVTKLLKRPDIIDVVIPRGGESLIQAVVGVAQMPVIKNDRGLCHLYVHEDADLKMAVKILLNGKTQRPGVCNALETLLVHEKIATKFLPEAFQELQMKNVKWNVCNQSMKILRPLIGAKSLVKLAKPKNYDTEYLDLEMNCKVVHSLENALEHIETHGSRHSEAIITTNEATARKFQSEVDAAAVYWNASTRFTDGFEMGLGGEIGVSTQKLHVRGPVGLKELTSVRWILDGNGETRN